MKQLLKKIFCIANNQSIRDDLHKIKIHLFLIWYKWLKSFSKIPETLPSDLLHIGCGPLVQPGWINVDLYPAKGVYYVDARNPLPFRDSTFRYIHCEHFLGYLEQKPAVDFLAECFRVLKPGGSLRIIVPDVEKYIHAYATSDSAFFKKMENLARPPKPLRTPCEVINMMFRLGGTYYFSYDFETLSLYMREIGFIEVSRSSKDHVPDELNIDGNDWWREVESLYVNAIKP